MKSAFKVLRMTVVALLLSSSDAQATEGVSPTAAENMPAEDPSFLQKEKDLMDLQMKLNDKWAQLRDEQTQKYIEEKEASLNKLEQELNEYQKANQDMGEKWHKLSLKQQLAGILDGFKDQGEEIWSKESSLPTNLTVHVDTVNSHIGVFSDEKDIKGRPTHQWELDKNTGLIIKTTRAKDGSEVHVTEKEIDIEALMKPTAPVVNQLVDSKNEKSVAQTKQQEEPKILTFDEEFDLEQQRDMAFKIMQFMIGFIIVTFGLLYVFFRMTQENEKEARQVNAVDNKGLINQDSTFIDFLSGRMDYEYIVKPTQPNSNKSASITPVSSQQHAQAQIQAQANVNRKSTPTNHRMNNDFGGNNLEHLATEERGRFDDFDIEGNQKTDFSLLANFSKK